MKIWILAVLALSLNTFADETLAEYGRFLAAIPCKEAAFQTLQEKPFYKEHKAFVDKFWKHLQKNTLAPLEIFGIDKGLIDGRDTETCFYPFGGPDFLFASTFYPDAAAYVLLGYEPCGTIFDLRTKKDSEVATLLQHFREAIVFMQQAGYFKTLEMEDDFADSLLNGTLHPLLFFAVLRGCELQSIEYGHITDSGEWCSSEKPTSVRIHLTDRGTSKTLMYISCDLHDSELKKHPGIEAYISSQAPYKVLLKAASYLPSHPLYTRVTKLICEGASKIIQDDTGIRFKTLKQGPWDLTYWGTYTKTIKLFKNYFQPDLKKALAASPNNYPLPFHISYNSSHGEGMLILAKRRKD